MRGGRKLKHAVKMNLSQNFWLVLYCSHYNMAVELEYLNRGDEAILSYDKAKSIFTRELNC